MKLSLRKLWRVLLCLGTLFLLFPNRGLCLDDYNSTEIARCERMEGYEKDAKRALDVLKKQKIDAMVEYLTQPTNGVKAATNKPREAAEWVLEVNTANADLARKVIAAEIKKGLHAVLIEASGTSPK